MFHRPVHGVPPRDIGRLRGCAQLHTSTHAYTRQACCSASDLVDDHGFVRGTFPTRALSDQWVLAVLTKANLLVTGRRAVVDRAIREVSPWLRHPIVRVTCRPALTLPVDASTLILHGVDALTDAEQTKLQRYLDGAHTATQVISSTAAPLYPLVQAGMFSEVLYYRLNMVYLPFNTLSHQQRPITTNPSSWN